MTDIETGGPGTDASIGTVLGGRFRLESRLGSGGMATVYLANDESLGRAVAIKVFRRDLADGEDLQRQRAEIQLLASLNHPSLVTLFDAATDDNGNAFIVMELVTGTDLRTRLGSGPLPPSEVAIIGGHLADALAHVHARGVIHRDIKPGNILLPDRDADDTGPQAKLADFGIARIVDGSRLTATGLVIGTASYFSPEQALGEAITPASDIYALGLVLLECLTGKREFPGTAVESMTARLARDPAVPRSLGDSWVGVLRGMTSRTPDARPTARDVWAVLARLAETPTATLRYPAALRYPATPGLTAETVGLSGASTEVIGASTKATGALTEVIRADAGAAQPKNAAQLKKAAQLKNAAQPKQAERTKKFASQPKPELPELPEKYEKSEMPRVDEGAGDGHGKARHRPWKRIGLTAGSVVGVLLLSWLAVFMVGALSVEDVTPATPEYPVVDGPLGSHLEQLQRSVEP